MELTVRKIIDTNNGIQEFIVKRDVSADVAFKVSRIADILQREALRVGKQIDKMQADHGAVPIPEQPGRVKIVKDAEEYFKKVNELYDTTVDVADLTDRIPLSRLRKVTMTAKEMSILAPFVDADVEWND